MRQFAAVTVLAACALVVLCACDKNESESGASNATSSRVMPPERHCELAVRAAKHGDCFSAGEHLAYCGDADEKAGDEARGLCAEGAPSSLPPLPDPAPSTLPTSRPSSLSPELEDPFDDPAAEGPGLEAAKQFCNQAIAAATSGDCARAASLLAQCKGAHRTMAQAQYNAKCGGSKRRRRGVFRDR